ncbi:hypothetical protein ACOSQ2_019530 [Xanthoceras sorbifolium]
MYGNQDMIQERGIVLDELWNTFVPMIVNRRRWGRFVQQPIRASKSIILEFYATMIPDVFKKGGLVSVKGRQVDISVKSINEYFRLEDVNHMSGHTDDPVLTLYNEELVKDLRRSGKGSWLSSRAVLIKEELHFDAAFWKKFCLYSLFSKSSNSMLILDMAYVLYSICHNLPINFGYIIRQQIAVTGYCGVGRCGFPSLITHFCVAAGIHVYAGHEILLDPSPLLDRHMYNQLASEHHEPELFPYDSDYTRQV